MSCPKKKQKPLLPLKTLDVIFRRKYVPNTQYYFSNRKHTITAESEEKRRRPSQPFKIPGAEKILSYIKYSDRKNKLTSQMLLAKPLYLKDNVKMAQARDISSRLYLEEPVDDVRAVVEVDPEFFTIVEGRPLRFFDDIKVYVNNIRNYAMHKQQIGYRRDMILNIERSIVEESSMQSYVLQNYHHHLADFQKFLTEDYKKACLKGVKAETLYQQVATKDIEYLSYVTDVVYIQNRVFKLDAIRNTMKIFRRFLMHVAPITWRQIYDESLTEAGKSGETEQFLPDDDLVNSMDVDKIVELATIELKNPAPSHLYFTEPDQMIDLFRTMELQSREYLIQLSKTYFPYRVLQETIKQLKQTTKQELDYFQYYIDTLNSEIQREEYNEILLQEKFFKILNNSFFDTVASPSLLKLKICIEYVYEQVLGKCDEGHHNVQDPLKILEIFYEEYNVRLDSLDFKIVDRARNECFAQDLKLMKNAQLAGRELKAFREMTTAMNKVFKPRAKFTRPPKKSEQTGKDFSTGVTDADLDAARPVSLTAHEKECLLWFTEWCEDMNPEPYLEQYRTYVKPLLS